MPEKFVVAVQNLSISSMFVSHKVASFLSGKQKAEKIINDKSNRAKK